MPAAGEALPAERAAGGSAQVTEPDVPATSNMAREHKSSRRMAYNPPAGEHCATNRRRRHAGGGTVQRSGPKPLPIKSVETGDCRESGIPYTLVRPLIPVRHAPSLLFVGVIPCQSGHDTHGLDPCKIQAIVASPERGRCWTRIRIHANHTIRETVSWLFVLMIFRRNSE